MAGSSLRQKIKQKLLKPKYSPHTDDEALVLTATAQRSGSNDIVLDAPSPSVSRPSSRATSAAAESPCPNNQVQLVDADVDHDIKAALLGGSAAAGVKSDQGTHPRSKPESRVFKGCFPFQKHPSPTNKLHDGLPTAFNNRQSILSRLNRAAKKPAQVPTPPEPKAKPAPKAKPTPTKIKKIPHPLHAAAWRINVAELLQLLVKPGADVNKRDKNSMTSLHYAAWQGSVDCVQLLLDHGADVNKADAEGMLPIHFAALFNRLDVAGLLLDRGSLLQPPASKGRMQVGWPTTPLICAAKMGHVDMVSLLMDRGADIAGVSKAAKSALHEAVCAVQAEVVAEMLRRGANHDLALPKSGYRPLHLAALQGSDSIVQVLLLGGADVNARAKDGRTPLHLACERGNTDAATALMDLGGADLAARDLTGLTPLHIAVDKNHLQLAKTLMDRGAATDAASEQLGAIPLNFAHDPDFYKLLRAIRWYGATSCPTGNNPSSCTYVSSLMGLGGTNTAMNSIDTSFFEPASAVAGAAAAAAAAGYSMEVGSSSAAAAAWAPVGLTEMADAVMHPAAVPAAATSGMDTSLPAGPVAPTAAATGSKGLFGKASKANKPSKPNKSFPASSWLKSLQLPSKQRGKESSLAATTALAQGHLTPPASAAAYSVQSELPVSSSAPADAPYAPYAPEHTPLPASAPALTEGAAVAVASHSRNSSISFVPNQHNSGNSPTVSEGSSIVARRTAAEMARTAIEAVVARAAAEEHGAAATGAAEIQPAGALIGGGRAGNGGSSPGGSDDWSGVSSVRSPAAISTVHSSTHTTLRRLLGFEDEAAANIQAAARAGKVAAGDAGPRRSIGDQDKWLPSTAAAAADEDDTKAAEAGNSSSLCRLSAERRAADVTSCAAPAAASTAAVAATAGDGPVDAVKGGGSPTRAGKPSGGSASKGSAGKRMARAARAALKPWRS